MSDNEKKFVEANKSNTQYGADDLSPSYPSQRPETLDPGYFSGIDHLKKNMDNYYSPSILTRNKGPWEGIVVKAEEIQDTGPSSQWNNTLSGFESLNLPSYRVYVPAINRCIPSPEKLGYDFKNCPPGYASMLKRFVSTSKLKELNVRPGDTVWVDFLDRENFEECIFIEKINGENDLLMDPEDGNGDNNLNVSSADNNSQLPRNNTKYSGPPLPVEIINLSLTSNITLEQLVEIEKNRNRGIDNTPTEIIKNNLRALAINVLQPLCNVFGSNIKINSGYRSVELNNLVGGSTKSQHLTGEAADVEFQGVSNLSLAYWIKNNIPSFDELILEHHNLNNPNSGWVHVSYSSSNNRRQLLTIASAGSRIQQGLPPLRNI